MPQGVDPRAGSVSRPFAPVPVAIAGLALLTALQPAWGAALEFDRAAMLQGQLWRALTSHCVHWDAAHLLANTVGACLIAAWFRELPGRFWVVTAVAASLAIATALLLEPDPLDRYRGLSGVLYGWWVAALLTAVPGAVSPYRRRLQQAVALGVTLWALVDATGVTAPLRTADDAAPVHAAAHLYGIFGACIGALCLARLNPPRSARNPAESD